MKAVRNDNFKGHFHVAEPPATRLGFWHGLVNEYGSWFGHELVVCEFDEPTSVPKDLADFVFVVNDDYLSSVDFNSNDLWNQTRLHYAGTPEGFFNWAIEIAAVK